MGTKTQSTTGNQKASTKKKGSLGAPKRGGSTSRIPAWLANEVVARVEIPHRNVRGNEITIIAEVRRVKGTDHLKVRAGRYDERSIDHISRSWWYEDVPVIQKAVAQAHAQAAETFTQLTWDRTRRIIDATDRRIRDSIRNDPDDWRIPLLEMEEQMASAKTKAQEQASAAEEAIEDEIDTLVGDD